LKPHTGGQQTERMWSFKTEEGRRVTFRNSRNRNTEGSTHKHIRVGPAVQRGGL